LVLKIFILYEKYIIINYNFNRINIRSLKDTN
jgi:hypothetical protein